MLIVICGATATGKSALALAIAQRLETIIISADSRLVYREFDIGTAKPSLEERQLVSHYAIDICPPTQTLTVAEYQQQTQETIADFWAKKATPPLLVGGTGLYVKAIIKGMKIPRVAPQTELRSQLEIISQTQLYAYLQQVDPTAARKIHPNDRLRTTRALEVYYTTGIPISQQQGECPPNYPILQIGLDCDVGVLDSRIFQRTRQMMELGLVEEVKQLGEKYGWQLPLLGTLGYSEVREYLHDRMSLSETIDSIALHTRQFAKRQRTWFRAIPEIKWFDVNNNDLVDRVWQTIAKFRES
jgi:tRNA dimethylallyltransferase